MNIPSFYKGLFNYSKKFEQEKSNTYNKVSLNNLVESVTNYLIHMNDQVVKNAIKNGERDKDVLLDLLSDWSNYNINQEKIISFIGIRLTTSCNLIGKDRCIYCNQKHINEEANLNDYKSFMNNIYKNTLFNNFYFSISGGEPLLWGKKLYGDKGLISFLNENGTYVNMNSNLHLLNSDNIIDIIESGLNSLRVSFDVSNELLFDDIVTKGSFKRTLFSIYLLIRYKELLQRQTPRVFYNVVATKINVNGFGDLVDFLIEFLDENIEVRNHEVINSLMSIHLIPLGGESNRYLMPEYSDWYNFITTTIPQCEEKWKEFLNKNDLHIFDFNSFGNPLNQDMYQKPVNDIINDFVNEDFNKNIKTKKCHCAPTQIYILPNGNVYPCSCHAERLFKSLGNIKEDSFEEIIKRNINYLNTLPNHNCKKCPISVVKLNVRIEENLNNYINDLVNEAETNLVASS